MELISARNADLVLRGDGVLRWRFPDGTELPLMAGGGTNIWPFAQFVAPAEIWIAPVGEAFPDLADAPTGNWVKIADKDTITEDGVTIRYNQDINIDNSRTFGSTLAKKGFRTNESLEIEFTVKDMSAATLAAALDLEQTVTDTAAAAGTAGNLNFPVERGVFLDEQAVLVRHDASPDAAAAADNFKWQLEVYRGIQLASPEVNPQKDNPAAVTFMLGALQDSSGNFAIVRSQDEAAV